MSSDFGTLAPQVSGMDDRPAKERLALKVAALCGLILAIGVDLLWLIGLFPAMDSGPWRWPLALLTCAIQTTVSVLGAIAFAWLHRKLRVNLWFAIPYGAIAGAIVGGLSIGLAIGVRTWLGVRTGMITFDADMAYMNTEPGLKLFLNGFGSGFAFGALTAWVFGVIGSLVLSFSFRTRRKEATRGEPPSP